MVFTRTVITAKQSLDASPAIRFKAKELRKRPTNAEERLWKYLRRGQINGFYFRRQHPYGIYILDFFCFKANLAIEVDGPIHLQKQDYDSERSRFIESTGVKVLRFNNEEIEKEIDQVIKKIREVVSDLSDKEKIKTK